MSVSPDGALGYGSNLATITTQVPKYRRFKCLAKFPKSGGRQGWLVVDLIPRGPDRATCPYFQLPALRTIDRAVKYP